MNQGDYVVNEQYEETTDIEEVDTADKKVPTEEQHGGGFGWLIGFVLLAILVYALSSWLSSGFNLGSLATLIVVIVLIILLAMSIKQVRPRYKAVIERFGKFNRVVGQGLTFIIPFVDRIYYVDITEQMVNAEPQEVITKNNLNAIVDAQVYFKVKSDDQNVKNSQYNVYNYGVQIVALARTTLRNVIGTMDFNDVNSQRSKINQDLQGTMQEETKNWGIEIVRTELKEIQPPKDVQETMNTVLKAEKEKQAAIDFATARETEADGFKRAAIKKAEGEAQAVTIVANAKASAIKSVSESSNKYFVGNAQLQRKLEVAETALKDNTKYVIPQGTDLTLVISEDKKAKIVPVKK